MTLEQSREYEESAQNFRFRSIVEIFDARVQRRVFVPLRGPGLTPHFPTPRFEISIQIDAKADYVVKAERENNSAFRNVDYGQAALAVKVEDFARAKSIAEKIGVARVEVAKLYLSQRAKQSPDK